MKQLTVLSGIMIALLFAVATPVAIFALQLFLPPWSALRVAIACGAVAYVVYLSASSQRRTGRTFVILASAVTAAALVVMRPTFGVYLMTVAAGVWAARTVLLARSPLHAVCDALLVCGALAAAATAAAWSSSAALAVWSFLLVLAGAPLLSGVAACAGVRAGGWSSKERRFENAHQAAECALAALSRRS